MIANTTKKNRLKQIQSLKQRWLQFSQKTGIQRFQVI